MSAEFFQHSEEAVYEAAASRILQHSGLTVQEYQQFYKLDLDLIKLNTEGRGIQVDGIVGPATTEHIFARRCCVHDTTAFAGWEEARIPDACNLEYRIGIKWDTFRSGSMGISKETFQQMFAKAFQTWRSAIVLQMVESMNSPHCTVDFQSLSGSILAWSNLANNTCNRGQQQRYDVRSWSEKLAFLTILHELGHLLGLGHNSGNYIMNPSILMNLDTLTSNDIQRAINLGYKPATDNPPPDNGGKWYRKDYGNNGEMTLTLLENAKPGDKITFGISEWGG